MCQLEESVAYTVHMWIYILLCLEQIVAFVVRWKVSVTWTVYKPFTWSVLFEKLAISVSTSQGKFRMPSTEVSYCTDKWFFFVFYWFFPINSCHEDLLANRIKREPIDLAFFLFIVPCLLFHPFISFLLFSLFYARKTGSN